MDVARAQRLWRDQHRAQAHRMGGGQVARVILEHRRRFGVQPVKAEHRLERYPFGLGPEIGVLDAIDGIEEATEPPRFQYPCSIERVSVGVDDPTPRQGRDGRAQTRFRLDNRKIEVVDMGEKSPRINLMLRHQTGQRGAVEPPVMGAQPVGLGPPDLQVLHHPIGHPDLDLVKKAHPRRVKRIVEVKDPGADMREICGKRSLG